MGRRILAVRTALAAATATMPTVSASNALSKLSSTAHRNGPIFVFVTLFLIAALFAALVLLSVLLYITIARAPSTTSRSSLGRSAAVVVLGDVGRSPRMCLHAQSLAEDGWRVAIVGLRGTPPPPPLRRSSVKHHYLEQPFDQFIKRLPRTGSLFALVVAPLKLLGQSSVLFWTLATQVKPPPELIIVQTPPALPSLFVVRLVGTLLGSRIIVDWHNLGYSLLSLRMKESSPIVRLAKLLEKYTGHYAFAHLCVTRALKRHLEESWHVKGPVKVLYDRPPPHFRRAKVAESHRLFSSLIPRLTPHLDTWFPNIDSSSSSWSPFTVPTADGKGFEPRADRPAIVVSSTSWTADEDFGMLLKAASLYEHRARELNKQKPKETVLQRFSTPVLSQDSPQMSYLESPMQDEARRLSLGWGDLGSRRDKNRRASFSEDLPKAKQLPKMLLIVTGKGELRDHYIREIERIEKEENWQWVRIRTAWLQSEEYPVLLGSADVGVSLHTSSSGMDLPMKVVDMLGCGLTVCALGFPCLGELVKHGGNGLVFYTERELAAQLESLFAKHPEPSWLASRMADMSSFFPEDVPPSPPMSLPASPVLPFTPVLGSRSPPESPSRSHRPSSPMPTMTLLQSPLLFASELSEDPSSPFKAAKETVPRTWTVNWKQVLRPLLAAADEAEAAAERKAKFASQTISPQRPSKAWTTSRWNGAQFPAHPSRKSSTPRSSLEQDSYGSHAGLTFGEGSSSATVMRQRRMIDDVRGDGMVSPNVAPSHTERSGSSGSPRRGHLRQRTNKRSENLGLGAAFGALMAADDDDNQERSAIPGIQISAPTLE